MDHRARAPAVRTGFAAAALLAVLAFPAAAGAQAGRAAPASAAPTADKRVYTEEETSRLGAEARRKAEARQRAWDRDMKTLTGSVCKGC